MTKGAPPGVPASATNTVGDLPDPDFDLRAVTLINSRPLLWHTFAPALPMLAVMREHAPRIGTCALRTTIYRCLAMGDFPIINRVDVSVILADA